MKWTIPLVALLLQTSAAIAPASAGHYPRCDIAANGWQPQSRPACYRGCLGYRVRAWCNRWCDNHCRY